MTLWWQWHDKRTTWPVSSERYICLSRKQILKYSHILRKWNNETQDPEILTSNYHPEIQKTRLYIVQGRFKMFSLLWTYLYSYVGAEKEKAIKQEDNKRITIADQMKNTWLTLSRFLLRASKGCSSHRILRRINLVVGVNLFLLYISPHIRIASATVGYGWMTWPRSPIDIFEYMATLISLIISPACDPTMVAPTIVPLSFLQIIFT